MSEPDEEISDLSFEAALKRLEEIVRRLESGDESLDESIRLYGEGDALRKQCEARLAALAIARSLLAASGGTIVSKPAAKGALFEVCLPAAR